ncbi:MAG TPA: hypothetical protein VID27_02285 [Blastocatellia bacterium]|jgi:hydrogenase maturation protease
MKPEMVEEIVNAVLYEGYILYPYRASAIKNQQRWNFGALYPQSFSQTQAAHSADAWTMQTECLATGPCPLVDVRVRFLHLIEREVSEIDDSTEGEIISERVEASEIDSPIFQSWQEAVERNIYLSKIDLNETVARPLKHTFNFSARHEVGPMRDETGRITGVAVRRQEAVEGSVEVAVERTEGQTFRIAVGISNTTPFADEMLPSRDEALMRSLVSTHTILSIRAGEFVSLLDPPDELREAAASCRNVGTWPVLVGDVGERDMMLSSPIILYDYPQVAPESAGNLFDSTEIDEILTLRILSLTDEEKREMRGVDERARRLLERTESLSDEKLKKLHGTLRGLRPVKEDER